MSRKPRSSNVDHDRRIGSVAGSKPRYLLQYTVKCGVESAESKFYFNDEGGYILK